MNDNLYSSLKDIVLPVVTLVFGWFAKVFRDKQKKEHDILDNVQQILDMQKKYIEQQQSLIKELNEKLREKDQTIEDAQKLIKRVEAKLDRKERSIRQANKCKYTNEGGGCPVLRYDEEHNIDIDINECATCQLKVIPK